MSDFTDIQRDLEVKARRLIRRVRTPEGMAHFGQPIGSIITRDVVRSGAFSVGGRRQSIRGSMVPNQPRSIADAAVSDAAVVDEARKPALAATEVPTDYEGTRKWKVPGRRGRVYTWQDEDDKTWILADHKDEILAEGDTEQSVIDAIKKLIKVRKEPTKRTRATGKHIQPFRKATEEDLQKLVEVHGSYMAPPPLWRASAMVADMDEFWNFEPPLKWLGNNDKVQPRYTKAFRDRQDAKKFDRGRQLIESGDIKKLDKWLKENWRTDDTAAALFLMRKTGMRPSSEDNESSGKPTFGATTLQARHVTVNQKSVRVLYEGKGYWKEKVPDDKRKKQDHTYRDPELVELFTIWSKGKKNRQEIFPGASDTSLRAAMKEGAGGDYKVYDLRTLIGTQHAIATINSMRPPKDAKEFKKLYNEVGDAVSHVLGNTRAVALASYIDPAVFNDWKEAIGDD